LSLCVFLPTISHKIHIQGAWPWNNDSKTHKCQANSNSPRFWDVGCSSYLSRALNFAPQQTLIQSGMCLSIEPTFPPLRKQFNNFIPSWSVKARRVVFREPKGHSWQCDTIRTTRPFIQERSRKGKKRTSVSKIEAFEIKICLIKRTVCHYFQYTTARPRSFLEQYFFILRNIVTFQYSFRPESPMRSYLVSYLCGICIHCLQGIFKTFLEILNLTCLKPLLKTWKLTILPLCTAMGTLANQLKHAHPEC
jgi:hypothetical protein